MVLGERTVLRSRSTGKGAADRTSYVIFRARLMRVTYTWRNVSFRQDVALNFDRASFHFYFESRVNMTGQIVHLIAATVSTPGHCH